MATRSNGLTLEMNRALPAASSLVFEAFTDPNELARWWGPEGFSTPSLEFDPRVGESYRIEMQPPEGDAFHLTGEFFAVDPPTGLADLGDSTQVMLTQGPFKTEARRGLHRDGWRDSFNRLERTLHDART